MSHFFRAAVILWIVLRYGLDELVLSSFRHRWLRRLGRMDEAAPLEAHLRSIGYHGRS